MSSRINLKRGQVEFVQVLDSLKAEIGFFFAAGTTLNLVSYVKSLALDPHIGQGLVCSYRFKCTPLWSEKKISRRRS